jgi:hypothetical protein
MGTMSPRLEEKEQRGTSWVGTLGLKTWARRPIIETI